MQGVGLAPSLLLDDTQGRANGVQVCAFELIGEVQRFLEACNTPPEPAQEPVPETSPDEATSLWHEMQQRTAAAGSAPAGNVCATPSGISPSSGCFSAFTSPLGCQSTLTALRERNPAFSSRGVYTSLGTSKADTLRSGNENATALCGDVPCLVPLHIPPRLIATGMEGGPGGRPGI